MIKLLLFICLVIIISVDNLFAQRNLVLEADFENPVRDSFFHTIDYYKIDNHGDRLGVPLKYWYNGLNNGAEWNKTFSRSGNSFMPLFMYWPGGKHNFGIYNIMGQLRCKLTKDKYYQVNLYAKPYAGNALIKNIGVALIDNTIDIATKEIIDDDEQYNKHKSGVGFDVHLDEHYGRRKVRSIGIKPDYTYDKWIDNKDSFTTIQFVYKAKGGEQYIYIGNFVLDKPKNWKKTKQYGYWENPSGEDMCVYGIDDVSVVPMDSTDEGCPVNLSYSPVNALQQRVIATPKHDSVFLKTFYYETDKADYADDVQLLISQINSQPANSVLHIIGHTDKEGTESYNQTLSQKRADNIYQLLKDKVKQPIVVKGVGYTQPIDEAEKSTLNRRVEVYLVKP